MHTGDGSKMERLLATVLLLCGGKRMRTHELAEMFEVSVRTIHRDIETLTVAGIPLRTARGPQGGIQIEERYRLESNLLSGSELAAIAISLTASESTNCIPDVDRITRKVRSLVPEHEQDRFQRAADCIFVDLSPWNDSDSRKARIELIEQSISNRQVLAIDYLDSENKGTNRWVEPHTLVLRGTSWYLYAFCRLREEFRVFRMSRIRRMQLAGEQFERKPIDNSCLPWSNAWNAGGGSETVRLRLDPLGYAMASECFPEETIASTGDGTYILDAEFPDHEWVARFILSFGDHAEVLSPKSLRAKVGGLAEGIARKHLIPASQRD